jgi:hypothetical protein
VDPRKFQAGDWVLMKVSLMMKNSAEGKLAPKWEGLYQIVKCYEKWAYHLKSETGKMLPRAWNAEQLKKYYM